MHHKKSTKINKINIKNSLNYQNEEVEWAHIVDMSSGKVIWFYDEDNLEKSLKELDSLKAAS